MADFGQQGPITTLHDLGDCDDGRIERRLDQLAPDNPIGLVLPVTADDMRADPFQKIVDELAGVKFIERIVIALGVTQGADDFADARARVEPLGASASVLWTDGPRLREIYDRLEAAGLSVGEPGKGQAVWTAFGSLLAERHIKTFALHDCDIVGYRRNMLARLCLPMVEPSFDFEYCKAYYARVTDRLHGRVVRLLIAPLLRSLRDIVGPDPFLVYLDSFRYPLAGEFAITANLARSNRIPSDWGLEIGTLAEVYRNTSTKRVCQVDLCDHYEHKHQDLSADDSTKGLARMATDILTTMFRTLSAMGVVLLPAHFVTLRSAYMRAAQDAIRKYHADSVFNGLDYDRHAEEEAVEVFGARIVDAGHAFTADPSGGQAIPNWTRVISAMPDLPDQLVDAIRADAGEAGDSPASS